MRPWRLARAKEVSIPNKLYKTGGLFGVYPFRYVGVTPQDDVVSAITRDYRFCPNLHHQKLHHYGLTGLKNGFHMKRHQSFERNLRKGTYLVNTCLHFPNLCIRWLF
jgi:hypothetical protein